MICIPYHFQNENLHAALKNKFKILDSSIPVSYLEHLPGTDIGKYTAISAVCASLYNLEHPGFPVNFLKVKIIQ